jgi:UDP-GlcNAc:undecaprenyl-phosphate/decaprenyl-phosphate GlcNAc-1-phosphate transferase
MAVSSETTAWLIATAIVPPMLISFLTLYPVRHFADRIGLLDRPGGHSTHTKVTPLGGGLGIYFGILITAIFGTLAVLLSDRVPWVVEQVPEQLQPHLTGLKSKLWPIWGLMLGGSILVGLGLADDRGGVSPWWRLLVEFLVAAFVVLGLGFELTAFIEVAWLTKLLSIVWIVGVINSFNMLDNMDGLSGGVAAIIALSMAAVMLLTPNQGSDEPQLFVAALLLVTAGSILGFLWHNRPPARIFMGDAGSYLVGYMIAVAMLMATFAGNGSSRPHAVFAPLCAMAIPMYDMITVIWIRIREGRSIFTGDRCHFSHRLVDLGLSRVQAVLTIYLVTATCGLASVLLVGVSLWQAVLVLGIVACMLLLVIILESTSWRKKD